MGLKGPWSLFSVDATTITVCSVGLIVTITANFIRNTTVCSVSNLCIVDSRGSRDLLLDHIECVHFGTPEVVGFLSPFLQSFASQIHSGVDSFTTSTNSILKTLEIFSFAFILSIIASACWHVSDEYKRNSIMGSTFRCATYLRLTKWDERKKRSKFYTSSIFVFKL